MHVSHGRTTSEPLMSGPKHVDNYSKEIIYNLKLEVIQQKSKYMDLVERTRQVFACLQQQLAKDKEEVENCLAAKDCQIEFLLNKLKAIYGQYSALKVKKQNFHLKSFRTVPKKPPRLRKKRILIYRKVKHTLKGTEIKKVSNKVSNRKSCMERRATLKVDENNMSNSAESIPKKTSPLIENETEIKSSTSDSEDENEVQKSIENLPNEESKGEVDLPMQEALSAPSESSSTTWEVIETDDSEIPDGERMNSQKKYSVGKELDDKMATIESLIKSQSGVQTSFKQNSEPVLNERDMIESSSLPIVAIIHPSESEDGGSRKPSSNSDFEASNCHRPGKFLQIKNPGLKETDASCSETESMDESESETTEEAENSESSISEEEKKESETSDSSETNQKPRNVRLQRLGAFRGERKSFSAMSRRF